jgi:type II secretory pathway component PulF
MVMSKAFQRMRESEAKRVNIDSSLTVKDDELLTFTESCRDLYEAGVPINEMLRLLQQSTPNPRFAYAIRLMVDDIENGKLLSEAMARYPNAFGEDYRSLISAAEKSGKWTRKRDKFSEMREGILDMLVSYIKRRSGAREKVKSGLIYPAVIALAIVGALCAFVFYIMPALRQIFLQIGNQQSLGLTTRMMFAFTDLADRYWWALPIIIAGIIIFAWQYWTVGNGKIVWMRYQLRLKVIGPLFIKMNLGEVMWLMGTLFAAGLTPQEVLSITMQSARNREIAGALELAKEYLFQGISFCDALKKAHWIFDGQTYMVISSAQKNGRLGAALQNYASQLFEKVDQGIDRVVKLIEPAMLAIAGVIVGLIAISYYSGLSSAIGSLAR